MNKAIATACCLLLFSILHNEAGAVSLFSTPGIQPSGEIPLEGRLFSTTLFTDTISGSVFNDLGGNAVKEIADPGLQNWRIRLFEASLEIDSTLSDAGGNYFFANLAPGVYTVTEQVQNGWSQTLPVSDGSYTLSILDGQTLSGNDFGNFQNAAISGLKFNDLNGNGVKDIGDPALSGWRIDLFLNSLHIDSTLTAAGGTYSFANLGPGTYQVSEGSLAGWTQTAPVSPSTYSVIPQSGQTVTGRDFGNFQRVSISGTKFEDINGNGIKDGGEPGLPGWRIQLYLGALHVDSALTDGSGNYVLNNVGPGTYSISEQPQAGWTQTLPASGAPYLVATQSGQNVTGRNFGNFRYGSISGMKFQDSDADGVKDGGEPGLPNWRIQLFRGTLHVDSLLTDGSGNYTFPNVGPGTYTLSEQLQAGWTQTMPPTGTYSVTLQSGQNATGKDFGNARNSGVRGLVFYDRNANGSLDAGEGGLTGWTVTATATQPQHNRSAVTQSGGLYNIPNLVADTYTISLSVKPNWLESFPPTTAYQLVVTTQTDTSGFDFGASTLNDSSKFRSYPVESLYVKKSVPRRRVESRWCFDFGNILTSTPVNGLHVIFSRTVDSITNKGPFPTAVRMGLREFDFSGAPIALSQIVELCGDGSRYGVAVRRWWWTFNGTRVGDKQGSMNPSSQRFLLPMPNTANVREEVFLQFFNTGMTIGIPRPDARNLYGWVVLPRSLSMYNSLISRGVTHTGVPGGFVSYHGRGFLGKKTTLTPIYHNNRLFADLVALKLNIAASSLAHTPPGFGDLVYEEPNNPLSGMTLNQIAARADSNLTFWVGVQQGVYANLDSVIGKVNAAFTAPMDTVSFQSFLRLTGVTSVKQIPFLRPSPETPPIIVAPKTDRTEEPLPAYTLRQNYPNPFNPTTTIEFELARPSLVTLKVYNILGQEVATLLDREFMEDGPGGVDFDASGFASGVYFYRLISEGIPDEEGGVSAGVSVIVKKMLLLK
jgi:SdrD B-like protein/type IX secretion system substrate protein